MIGAATCSGTKRALQTREKPECFLTVTEVELYGECPNYELLLVYCLYCPTQGNAYLVVKVDTLYPADAFFWLAITVAPCALTIKKKKSSPEPSELLASLMQRECGSTDLVTLVVRCRYALSSARAIYQIPRITRPTVRTYLRVRPHIRRPMISR